MDAFWRWEPLGVGGGVERQLFSSGRVLMFCGDEDELQLGSRTK
jgi:hypothetical protein